MKDVYGFEKKANPENDANIVAGIHGFRGPSYSDAQGTPVDLSMVDPSIGTRIYHGAGGGLLGGAVGSLAGGAIGRRFGYQNFGQDAGMYLGGALGAGVGAATTPKQLIMRPSSGEEQMTQNDPSKIASVDIYGFSKEALAAPGLGQMAGALRGMGAAAGSALRTGVKDYKLLPNTGRMESLARGARTVGHELMGSQAGRRTLGAGAGLAGAGVVGAGLAGYNALTQPAKPAPNNPPKTASVDIYGFSKEALAAPGLLGQMSGALRSMGRAGGVAAQRAGNMYGAEREYMNSGVGKSLLEAGRTGVGSLMKSQAGRRMIGIGAGLAGAGAVGTGLAGYNALTQPAQPDPTQPAQALRA